MRFDHSLCFLDRIGRLADLIKRRVTCPNGHESWYGEEYLSGKIRCPEYGCGLVFSPFDRSYDLEGPIPPHVINAVQESIPNTNDGIEDNTDQQIYEDPFISQVLLEVDKAKNKQPSSWKRNFGTLISTLFLFWVLGLIHFGAAELALLVGVIFFHEAGHLLAMYCFGFKDLRMIFIPLFGAAAMGKKSQPPGWQRAIIALAGPTPGIVLGCVLLSVLLYSDSIMLGYLVSMLIFLNLFNLLPILPLDGGHFFSDVVFCRTKLLESLFKFFAVAICLIAGLILSSIFLGILGFFLLSGAILNARMHSLSRKTAIDFDSFGDQANNELSQEMAHRIIPGVRNALPESSQPKLVAQYTKIIWEFNRHSEANAPGTAATILLMTTYLLAWLLPIVTMIVMLILIGLGVLPEPTNELFTNL